MKTVVFAAELGSGLGHVAPLAAIAERLVDRAGQQTIRPIFCVRDPVRGRAALGARVFPMLPSPFASRVEQISSHSASYAEILASVGFARRSELELSVAAWDDLFRVLDPALLVCDHSPTACLAARGRIPVLVTGNGYTVPPADMALFPALKAAMAPPAIQRSIMNVINTILAERGAPALQRLPELVAGDRRAVFTLPQLDPYGPLRHDRLLGPYQPDLRPVEPPKERHAFIYAGASAAHLEMIVQILGSAGVPMSAYLGGVESATSMFLKSRGGQVHDKPPALGEVLAGASMVVSHGGSGLAQAALRVGRPQVIAPIHAESQITAGRVEELGVGLALRKFSRKLMSDALLEVVEVRHFQERASAVATEIDRMGLPEDSVGEAVRLCAELMEGN
jgi:UDP:flavonoid glycosyltransferase YjiC (YdhE family)